MATPKEFFNTVIGAGEGVQNIGETAWSKLAGVFGTAKGAGSGALGGAKGLANNIGGKALDLLSLPFKAVEGIGKRAPMIGVVLASVALVTGYNAWKNHRKNKELEAQVEAEKQIALEQQKQAAMMQEAAALQSQMVAAPQAHTSHPAHGKSENHWQNKTGHTGHQSHQGQLNQQSQQQGQLTGPTV